MVNNSLYHYLPKNINIKKNNSIYDYYEILEEIGTGLFGVVHRCVEKSTGNVFAVKFIPTIGGEKQKEIIRNEIKIMSELKHSSIISLYDAFEMEQEMIMIYEFISGDELIEKISKDEQINENKIKDYIKQICEVIKYMHELSYVHLDLRPENIIFTTKQSNKLKINDFSLTTKLKPGEKVKVTTVNNEYSAPEILNGQNIGFNTDMWNIGILTKYLLYGNYLNNNNENKIISLEAKDFINKLIVNDKQKRMNINEALEHPWLRDLNKKEIKINNKSFYLKENENIKRKYDAWPKPRISIGRISQFSSLSKLYTKRYGICDRIFDLEDGLPYFVIKPKSIKIMEGKSATFFYKIISPLPIKESWWKNNKELIINDYSSKYCLKINNNDKALIIKELKNEDEGEYLVRAENKFGKRECIVMLNILKDNIKKNELLPIQHLIKNEEISFSSSSFIEKGPPHFSFLLRPRLIQKNYNCKLICTVSSDPPAKIEWIKDGKQVDEQRIQILFKSGVASLEIFNIKIEDSGLYTCIATNEFGCDKTSALVSVETRQSTNKLTNTSKTNLDNSFLMAGLVGERKNKLQNK